MPLQPVYGKLHMPVSTAEDVRALFEFALALTPQTAGRARYDAYLRDLSDYFYYIGALCPEHFRPLQEAMVTVPDDQLGNFMFTFPTWLYLLARAPDRCVGHLERRLAPDASPTPLARMLLRNMLAAICTPAALTALAEYARQTNTLQDVANLGFHVPPDAGPAVPRFTHERRAARLVPLAETVPALAAVSHPVGLPLDAVLADPAPDVVTWHYCSLDLDALPGMPAFPAPRLHLLSPPLQTDWTLYCEPLPDGRIARAFLAPATRQYRTQMVEMRAEAAARHDDGQGCLVFLPYDDQLIYSNSHTHRTPGVVGDLGGPPIGLYANPLCPRCGVLMFHVCTLRHDVREYGDGFRSLFVCEACDLYASRATLWN